MEEKNIIDNLKLNINKLKEKYEKSISENNELIKEIEIYKELKEKFEKKILELEEKNNQLIMSKAMLGNESGSEEAKNKIDMIVREIDKSIALLNK